MEPAYRNRFSVLANADRHHPRRPSPPPPVPSDDPAGTNTPDLSLIKVYFKILQAIHHTEILEEAAKRGSPPIGMAKKVTMLTSFIKPAAPNNIVLNKIKNNTKCWMDTNLSILREHYAATLRSLGHNLGPFQREAYDRALKWAHQRYKKKLTSSSVDTLFSILTHTNLTPPTPLFSSPRNLSFPPLPSQPQLTLTRPPDLGLRSRKVAHPTPFIHRNTLALPFQSTAIPSLLSLPPLSLKLAHRPFPPASITPAPLSHKQPDCPPLTQRLLQRRIRPSPNIIPTPTISPLADQRTYATVAANSPPAVAASPLVPAPAHGLRRPNRLSLGSRRPLAPRPPPEAPTAPVARPPVRVDPVLENVIDCDVANNEVPRAKLFTFTAQVHQTNSPPLIAPLDFPGGGEIPPVAMTHSSVLTTKKPNRAVAMRVQGSVISESQVMISSPLSEPTSQISIFPEQKSPPSISSLTAPKVSQPRTHIRLEPTIHPHTNRKATMWALTLRKPVLFVGDSNIARIPKFKHRAIQADSFPGATLRHLTLLLNKISSPKPDVNLVLLSVGINNCLREQTSITIIKEIRQLIRVARSTFPQAHIYFPLLTVSIRLSVRQLHCVKAFNSFVRDAVEDLEPRCSYLSQLPLLKFKTTHDNIHWTSETASAMMRHWMAQLDLQLDQEAQRRSPLLPAPMSPTFPRSPSPPWNAGFLNGASRSSPRRDSPTATY